jgi:hypothetical protein
MKHLVLKLITATAFAVFGMINQVLSVTPTKTRQILFSPNVTTPGTPLTVGAGAIPCITLDAYQQTIGGATCYFDGCYTLAVTAASSISPFTGKQINIGDPIYALGGSTYTDPLTGTVTTYGFTLCADSSGTLFGYLSATNSGPLTSGQTANVNVDLADLI